MQKTVIHCSNVANYAAKILDDKIKLFVAGLLHDVGKIKIPNSILYKRGTLTSNEFAIIKKHPCEGAEILKKTGYCSEIVEAVLHHHERWDGNGYPDGIKGKKIPLYSRVLAVADAFDAMVSDRPYRKALPLDVALKEIEANAGTQFDPDIVQQFLKKVYRTPLYNKTFFER